MDSMNGEVTSPGYLGYEEDTISTFIPSRRLGPGGLARARTRAVAAAQEREVHQGHVDLLQGQLGGGAAPVAEVDGHLAQPEAVEPGLVGHLAVHDVALDLDAVEV